MIPIKTWQFFAAAKKLLGTAEVEKLYKVGRRQIDRWACDPDFTTSSEKNPLDRIEAMIEKLSTLGHDDIAIAVVDRQARLVNCHLVRAGQCTPDKDNLLDEIIDDYPALTELHNAMRKEKGSAIVRALMAKVKAELDETFTQYVAEASGD